MPNRATFFDDYRRRNLAYLAAAALVSLLLALFAVTHQQSELSRKHSPQLFFPGLAAQLREVARIRIVTHNAAFDLVRGNNGGWSAPQHGNYPVSSERAQKLLAGLAGLETIEPKTSRPEWFHFVNLVAPPKGNGTLIDVRSSTGHPIASAIFGATEDIGDPSGAVGLFARKPSDTQSWLLRSVFELKGDLGDWLDKSVVSIDRQRIQEVEITPASGASYTARRDKPSDPDFTLVKVPAGRRQSSEGAADTTASALSDFTFDDVRPVGQIDFSGAARSVTKTFDGLTITTSVVQAGHDYWAKLSGGADSSRPETQQEAREITARAGPWAFKLPASKGQQFTPTLESLLKPVDAPAKTGQ